MIHYDSFCIQFRPACLALIFFLMLMSAGCVTTTWPPQKDVPLADRERRSDDYAVITAVSTDTYKSLAKYYFGDERQANLISDFNNNVQIVRGKELVIPLKGVNPGNLLYPGGYQTIPVLCYHKIGPKKGSSKLAVSEDAFDRQMAYLKSEGYHVLTMKQFLDFIELRSKLPKKSVLITIDDGWKTTRTVAYPILKKYGFTAVLFVYTDLIKSKQNSLTLSWDDIRFLKKTGVFEIESHTVTHSDLNKISDEQISMELLQSQRIIKENTGETPVALAYPDGVFSKKAIDAMRKCGYKAGFTVVKGPNAFFYHPYSLNRTMVYNSERLIDFTKLLETYRQERL